MQLVHLTTLDSDDSLDLGVTSFSDVVANKEFIDKFVFALLSESDFISEVHGRVEELLVGQLHGSVGRLQIQSTLGQRRLFLLR